MEEIYTGVSNVRPKGGPAVDKQGGKGRAHAFKGKGPQRIFQDSAVSLLHSLGKLGSNIMIGGTKAFKAIHGKLRCDFTRRMSAHSIGNDQQGAPVIQGIYQVPVLVAFSA
jgi:hypothetical protein